MANEVTCLRCGATIPAVAQACGACGEPVHARCTACAQPIQEAFRFCPGCGEGIAKDERRVALASSFRRLREQMPPGLAEKVLATRGRIEGERKQVTVLFCDLVSSAALAEGMDPEDYRDLLDRYLAIVFDEVARVEGLVNQIAGDGVMALFGAPLAHEDAPTRALLAALAIRRRVRELGESLEAEGRPPLEIRIGLNTGPVIVGTVGGDLKMDYTAIGDTTNLAARLQAMARPDSILVSAATQRPAASRFAFRPLGRLAVRGKAIPVQAYEVESAVEGAIAPPQSEAAASRFVGRGAELARLEKAFERAAGGAGGLVAVVGETGLGASSLIRELARRVGDRGAVLWGQCFSYTREAPYRPFIDILRARLGIEPGGEEAASERLASVVRGWGPELSPAMSVLSRMLDLPAAPASDLAAEEMQGVALEAISRLILAECEHATVVLVLEDAQWMDESSRELVQSLVDRARTARILVLCTQRPDAGPLCADAAGVEEIRLLPLSREESAEIVSTVVGGKPSEELVDAVVARAEGNPFFTEEVARALLDAGAVAQTPEGPVVTRALDELDVPVTVQEIVAARLDRLPPEEKRVAQIASVIGRHFSGALLDEVVAGDGIDVRARLEALERAGVVRRAAGAVEDYLFDQGLTQEVAYQGLLHKQQRQLHEQIGRALERRHGEGPSAASAVVAYHYRGAEKPDRAVHHLIAAAAHAESVPTYASAAELYRQAWELAGTDTDHLARQALDAGLHLLGLAALFGEGSEATIERMRGDIEVLLERMGTSADRVAGGTFLGLLKIMGAAEQHMAGLGQLGQALELAEREGLSLWRARVLRGLALGYALDGRFADAMRCAESALEASVAGGTGMGVSEVRLSARVTRDAVLLHRDELEQALAEATSSHSLAVELRSRGMQVTSAGHIATVHLLRGEMSEAAAWAERGLEVADAARSRGGVPHLAAIALLADRAKGGSVDVGRYLRHIEEELVGAPGIQQTLRFAVDAFLAAGEIDRAERVAQRVRRRAGGRLRQAQSAVALGAVAACHGSESRSRAEYFYDEAERVAREIGARSVLVTALLGRSRLFEQADKPARARAALAEAEQLGREIGMRWGFPP